MLFMKRALQKSDWLKQPYVTLFYLRGVCRAVLCTHKQMGPIRTDALSGAADNVPKRLPGFRLKVNN
uniref:SFRICE_002017 n=1 Tax=Spodoptera frugiperda TaxID=7108 RepID=A0A2H1VSM9_SPOFR